MICGIGIDTVEIERFRKWHTKKDRQLLRIFSPEEIAYCKTVYTKSAERFAVRFAAREAFFKAYHTAYYHLHGKPTHIPFLAFCRLITIDKEQHGIPICRVAWQHLALQHTTIISHISLSHTDHTATALIILES